MSEATYLQAAAIALLPSLAWGWFFISRNPKSKQLVVVTFMLGTLAVAPLLLFMAGLGTQLHAHDPDALPHAAQASMRQVFGLLGLLACIAVVLGGVATMFQHISRRIGRHSWRLGAMVAATGIFLVATLSLDQLRESFGPLGTPLAVLFHFLVIFSLLLFLLERFKPRTVANVAVAGLAAILVLVVTGAEGDPDAGIDLGSISTIFSLPFLLGVAGPDTLTLRVLNFLQVYLTLSMTAISTLLVVASVHVIYLLHEHRLVKVVHSASLAYFALPLLAEAVAVVTPGFPFAADLARVPHAFEVAWFVNIALLVALSAWSFFAFTRQSGDAAYALFTGLYEEPLIFVGVGLFLTVFVALSHAFGLSVVAFSVIFLAFGEEYSKHLIVRFTDDDSIRSIDDAIEFSIIVGLAFAFAENVLLYFPKMLAAGDIPALVLRSVLTVLMHAVASGILGYFYGLAHFSVEQVQKGHGGHGRVYRLLHQLFLFRRARVYHLVKMFQGLVIAGSYHASYNLAASQGRIGVMLVLVGGGCAFVYYLLGVKSDRQRTGAIAAERFHDTFVRRLRRRAT